MKRSFWLKGYFFVDPEIWIKKKKGNNKNALQGKCFITPTTLKTPSFLTDFIVRSIETGLQR